MTDLTLTVEKITPVTDRIAQISLRGDGALPDWPCGAHVKVKLPEGERAYSLIRFAPEEHPDRYTIAVQREDDGQGGSKAMHALGEGAEVTLSAPKCDFALEDAPALLLAGGIGITPMISMAGELAARGHDFDLHFAARSRAVIAFADELTEAFGDRVHLHFDDDDSRIDLSAVIGGLGDRHLYICGPRAMIDAARAEAERQGVPGDRVHVELFDNDAAATGGDSFEVELASTGEVFTIPADKSIIEVLEEAGHDLIYDCQRGDCGICQTEVIEGVPDHRDVVLSEAERESGKVMQICVSRAKTPKLVLDL